jgi:hypothetical protein
LILSPTPKRRKRHSAFRFRHRSSPDERRVARLQPVPAAAALVEAAGPFRHNPLEAQLAGLGEDELAHAPARAESHTAPRSQTGGRALAPAPPRERLAYLARKIHRLGERPLYELLRELEAGAPLRTTRTIRPARGRLRRFHQSERRRSPAASALYRRRPRRCSLI